MNKRYIDFPDLAPSNERIILHADPTTSELGKCPVNALPYHRIGFLDVYQSGTDAPVVANSYNPVNIISFNRQSQGIYTLTFSDLPAIWDCYACFTAPYRSSGPCILNAKKINHTAYRFWIYDLSGSLVDDWESMQIIISHSIPAY